MIWKVVLAVLLLLVVVLFGCICGAAILLAEDAQLKKTLGPISEDDEDIY